MACSTQPAPHPAFLFANWAPQSATTPICNPSQPVISRGIPTFRSETTPGRPAMGRRLGMGCCFAPVTHSFKEGGAVEPAAPEPAAAEPQPPATSSSSEELGDVLDLLPAEDHDAPTEQAAADSKAQGAAPTGTKVRAGAKGARQRRLRRRRLGSAARRPLTSPCPTHLPMPLSPLPEAGWPEGGSRQPGAAWRDCCGGLRGGCCPAAARAAAHRGSLCCTPERQPGSLSGRSSGSCRRAGRLPGQRVRA